MSLVVITIDNSILNVALPTIVRDLGATGSDLQWIVDAYIIVFACLLLTAGALGDKFGRKGALTVGLVLFGGFSGLASFAKSPEMLILAGAASWASAPRSSSRRRCRSSPTPSPVTSGPGRSACGPASRASAWRSAR